MALFKKKQSADIPRRRQTELPNAIRQAAQPTENTVFRRNRTITGSISNAFQSATTNNDFESPRAHAHSLAIRRRKLTSVLLIVVASAAVLLWAVGQLTAQPVVNASSTSLSRPLDTARYDKAIQNYLDMNPFSRLRFILDSNALSRYLQQTLPEVSSVSQQGFAGLGETNFSITLRQPIAGWKIGPDQYYVDATGVPFRENYFATPDVEIIDNSGVTVQQGTAIVSNRFLSFVGRVVALANGAGETVSQAIIPTDTTRELEIRLKDTNFLVKLSIDRGAGEQVEDMTRAVTYLVAHGQHPQYIDVRVSGKAFYQ